MSDTTSARPSELSLGSRVFTIHRQLAAVCGDVARLAVAIYDDSTGMLRTFVESSDGPSPLVCYEQPLAKVPSLQAIADDRCSRTIDDLRELEPARSAHTRRLLEAGYRSSYTVPLYAGEHLIGFVFFDARSTAVFDNALRDRLAVYSQLLSALIAFERVSLNTLQAVIHTALQFSRFRDEETAGHLERVVQYVRLITQAIAPAHGLDDEFSEYVCRFSPLHDLGKIAIPDAILRKPGRLDEAEQAIMRTHVTHGVELVDVILTEFELDAIYHVDCLRNLVLYHHENFDGSGYLGGLAGEDIPIEARITRVADVFDALTSPRPYKAPWPLEQAMDYMREQAGWLFDPACVAPLLENRERILDIRRRFADEFPSAD